MDDDQRVTPKVRNWNWAVCLGFFVLFRILSYLTEQPHGSGAGISDVFTVCYGAFGFALLFMLIKKLSPKK